MKSQTRLLVSGCSFTDYPYATWADFLFREGHWDVYENFASPGADNAFIARNIVDHARTGDTVVVLWSGFDRWSRWSEKPSHDFRSQACNWIRGGSVRDLKSYMVHYYHPVERFQTTMDYISMVDLHRQLNGYTVYHFSAFPFFLGEVETQVHPEIMNIFSRYNFPNNFVTDLSLYDYMVQNKQEMKTEHQYNKNDSHPTPLTHWEYCSKIIAPRMNLTLNKTTKEQMMEIQNDLINNGIARK